MASSEEQLYTIRHSLAHIMAEAVLDMFPDAKTAIGPPIDTGFYYDFDLPRPLTTDDLLHIETSMKQILRTEHDFVYREVERAEALAMFKDQPYKCELIDALPEDATISVYTVDRFTDLCKGPHVKTTKEIDLRAFKLMSVAGAYWRGDSTKPMLQRIYATAWKTKQELHAHLNRIAEAEKRDHRKLGRELDLFSTHEEAGPGLIYWHPKGALIRTIIEDYWRKKHYAHGYDIVYSPHIGKSWLWETSGHLDFYNEGMFPSMEMDKADYYAKPMNCPFHIMMYNTKKRSYHELPLRWAELGTVYRYEASGVLHGLLRVRGFTQDDAHIFCTPDQIEAEIARALDFSLSLWRDFGFDDIKAFLATKPEKSVGDDAEWEQAEHALRQALEHAAIPVTVDEGGGAFYGPKIDLKINDAIGREWQMTTIQFDFNLPRRFKMTFVDSDGKEKTPYMVHRALLGSIERFFGVLIEQYAGAFPIWLAPQQVVVVPVAPAINEYAQQISKQLQRVGIRASADVSTDRMNAKIRHARLERIPYIVIVGESEQQAQTISYKRRGGDQKNDLSIQTFIDQVQKEIGEKVTI